MRMNRELTGKVQRALLDMGYRLPRYGADGWWGDETEAACDQFCEDHDIPDAVPYESVSWRLLEVHDAVQRVGPFPGIDSRGQAEAEDVAGRRKWSEIDSLLVHQMATVFGGDKFARIPRISANCSVTVRGEALRMHDPLSWVWHAQGFSKRSIGIEIEGYYSGVEGEPRTFWKPKSKPDRRPMVLTPAVIQGALDVMRWYVRIVEAHGGKITTMLTHRQAYPSKPSDPGEAIYKAICLPIMDEFGLSGGDEYRAAYSYLKRGRWVHVKPGRPVPNQWDSRQQFDYDYQPKDGGVQIGRDRLPVKK